MIIIVFGLPGSGKSYFASRLAGMVGAYYIKSDQVRKEMFGLRTYSEKEKLSVYDRMLSKLMEAHKPHDKIILDATFHKREMRNNFTINIGSNEAILFIEVEADEFLIRERLKKTREDSEADFEVYKKLKDEWEPMNEPHLILHSTNDNIEDLLLKTMEYIKLKNDQGID
ncbi:MAG: AAA family ATPase [Ferruginibacter sp.]